MKICIDAPALGGSMQICIAPTRAEGIDATLHRSAQGWGDGCKFASIHQCKFPSIHPCKFASIPQVLRGSMQMISQGLGGSMQICIDPLRPGGIDENLHRPPFPRRIDANLHRSHQR